MRTVYKISGATSCCCPRLVNIMFTNIHRIGVPEGGEREREKGAENISKT